MDGLQSIRLALLAGLIAPCYEYYQFLKVGTATEAWRSELGGVFVISAMAGIVAIIICFVAGWYLAYDLILFASNRLHQAFANTVPRDDWNAVTERSMRILPYVVLLGGVTWIVYSHWNFGGWPDDVIFGTIGNLLVAWFYVTLLVGWLKLVQRERSKSIP